MISVKINNRFLQHLFSLFILLFFSTFLYAQITVSQSEFMKVFTPGNPIYAIPGESGLVNIGNYEGSNIYDFSNVSTQNQFVLNNYQVSQIPEMATRYPADAITFGESMENIDEFPIFYSIADSTFLIGDVTIGTDNRFIHYTPYELFAPFPITHDYFAPEQIIDVFDTTYNSVGQISSTYLYTDFVYVELYGYGTLKLPDRELECLRMKRSYSWYQFKEFFFITREGVLVVISGVAESEPDTGYVNGDFIILSPDSIVSNIGGKEFTRLDFRLDQNYPNPFNPATIINYQLPITNYVELSIYNLLGQKIKTLVSARQAAGAYKVEWNAANLAGGVYYYMLSAGEFKQVRKMLLLK